MGVARDVARNTAIMITGNTVVRIISFVVAVYLARFLTVESYGKYSFSTAFVSFFAILANLGVAQILTREISKRRSLTAELVGGAIPLSFVLSSLSVLASTAVVFLAGYPGDIRSYVLLFSSTLVMDSLRLTYATVFRSRLRMEYHVLSNLVDRVISFVGIYLIISLRGSLLQIVLAVTIARFCALVVTFLASRRFARAAPRIDLKMWRFFLRESWPVALLSGFAMIYLRVDRLMLQSLVGSSAVGYYSVAYRLIEALSIISVSLQYSVFPVLSRYFAEPRPVFMETCRESFRYASRPSSSPRWGPSLPDQS